MRKRHHEVVVLNYVEKKRRDEQGERKAGARGKQHCWPARAAGLQVLDQFIQQDGLVEVQGDGEPLESGGDV